MKVSLQWLRQLSGLATSHSAHEVADRLVAAGLEVESLTSTGQGIRGPLVVGRVEKIIELEGFKKPIRHCWVDVGDQFTRDGGELRSIVCGAHNFTEGDHVVVALPGAVLAGDFAIASRTTYGQLSDGMICSQRELGLSSEHEGILVLSDCAGQADLTGHNHPSPVALTPGDDAKPLLGLDDEVVDLAVTPDRSYCLSMRGVAREVCTAFDLPFRDPAQVVKPVSAGEGWPVVVHDTDACPLFVAVRVRGIDPLASSPLKMQARLRAAGMRPINLAVDVTNLVMLELGQPLHAYNAQALRGAIEVRRASAGQTLVTLDGQKRQLSTDDLLIADEGGPLGLAGVMGGQRAQVSSSTTDIVVEAAYFAPAVVARVARRHKLTSEASRRFERGVDSALPLVAALRAAQLLTQCAGGTIDEQVTVVGAPLEPDPIVMRADEPDRLAGHAYGVQRVCQLLEQVGAQVVAQSQPEGQVALLQVTPATWRPDLRDAADLVEEVARLHGYDAIEPVLPVAPAGRGLSFHQRLQRQVLNSLVHSGCIETPAFPFIGEQVADQLMLDSEDHRRRTLRVLNPLSHEQPLLCTTLLPGLSSAVNLNRKRGLSDLALAQVGPVFFAPATDEMVDLPELGVDQRPTDEQVAALYAAVVHQPLHAAVVLCGQARLPGWWGPGRNVSFADAIEIMRRVVQDVGVEVEVTAAQQAPWHPGRCAQIVALPQQQPHEQVQQESVQQTSGVVLGYAGQLHPRVIEAFQLPEGTCAAEIDVDTLFQVASQRRLDAHPMVGVSMSTFPASTHDLAVTVPEAVPAATVHQALAQGAGPLLEHLRLFDVYTGDPIPLGHKSLTFALRLRADDRTLTAADVAQVRQAALARAADQVGAVLRTA